MTELRLPDAVARGRRRARLARPRAPWLWLLLIAVLATAASLSGALVQRGGHMTSPGFLDRALGAPDAKAPLVRKPARGVTVRLGRRGYSVAARQGTVALTSTESRRQWTRYAGGASRPTGFGRESVTVGPDRTEELLTVSSRQGLRTWRWNVRSTELAPHANRDGSISLSRPGVSPELRIAPVKILDRDGADVTPRGLRWTFSRASGGASLRLRLDDRQLPLPYVIDPAIDYPSPLYLSSTTSTQTSSWRLLTTAPSAANSATSTTPASNATGYYEFKPGAGNTSAGTPSGAATGIGFTQDLAGGTGIPAGSWSFSVKTQIAGANLVSGNAILAIGVWKGTISGNGTFHATQTILSPTDDPAAQNIRTSLGPVTTTVTYSLPAFNLATNERLDVEVWRKQVSGISSATAADRQVNLIVNDGISRVVHPAADDTAPVNSFQVANATGGVYFNNAGGPSGTIFYRGSAAGSFQLQDLATDTGSGVTQVTYPLVSKAGWTHAAETVTTGPSYQSSTYSWTAGAGSPGVQAIVAQDAALNASPGTPVTITTDITAPSAPTVALTSPPAWYTSPSVALTLTDGNDGGSGVDPASRIVQRDEAALTNGTCGAFPGTWATLLSNPDTTVQNGRCYRYRMIESDRVGNQSSPSAASATAKIDLLPPTQPTSLAFSALANASAAGSTLYYRPGVSGSFAVTPSGATDAESGVSSYVYPIPATWTVTGNGASRTYSWTAASTSPGTLGIHARDAAGNDGPDATFTPTADPTPPTTTDDTATIGSDWKQASQAVTLTPIDALSGVANTYYTTNGSTPTTGSPSGTSISLTADGTYTIRYFSVDNVGNAEPVRTAPSQIRIDKTAGTTTLGALPAVIRNDQTLTATASDATSGVASVAYYYCTPSPCTPATLIGSSSTGPSYSFTWSSQPPDGTYDLAARVTDNAGNVGTSAKKTVTIDNEAATATITAQPPDPSNSASASFSFVASDPSATFQCKLDGGAFANCTSPKAYSGVADGAHTFSLKVTDGAGNTNTISYGWTIDTVAPDTAITAQPGDPSNDFAPSFAFTSTETPSTFECKLDNAAFASCTSPHAFDDLADGQHTFSVRATDAAGNTDATPATYTWTIDTSGVALTADEVHYTFTGPTSVAFDWRGSPTDIRYGPTNTYGSTATAHAPDPLPFSSSGPFREVELTGLDPGTTDASSA